MKLSKIYYDYTKQFRTEKEAMYCLLHHIEPEDVPRCPMCGKLSKFVGKYYNMTCGECNYNAWDKKIQLTKQNTTKEAIKRGQEKARLTCLKHFGVPYGNQFSSIELKEKYEAECLEKYGVKNAGWSKEARAKRDLRMLPITVNLLSKGVPDKVKYVLFKRLNTGGMELKPQEIRNAVFQGLPIDTSSHSFHKIQSNKMAGTVLMQVRKGKFKLTWQEDGFGFDIEKVLR